MIMQVTATSPFKHEHALDYRICESSKIMTSSPNKVPVILDSENELPGLLPLRNRVKLSCETTAGQVSKAIAARIELDRNHRVVLLCGNETVHKSASMGSLYKERKDEDGFLYVRYRLEARRKDGLTIPASCELSSRGEEDAGEKSLSSKLFSKGWMRFTKQEEGATSLPALEMTSILSKSELKARQRFRNRLKKRAAGPREEQEGITNLKLAKALAGCKLDVIMSGMLEVATHSSSSSSPSSSSSSSSSPSSPPLPLCGTPCALRVHVASTSVVGPRPAAKA